jgi:hypothetical protein
MVIITTPFDIPDAALVTCRNGNAALFIALFPAIFCAVLFTVLQRNWQKLQTDCMR